MIVHKFSSDEEDEDDDDSDESLYVRPQGRAPKGMTSSAVHGIWKVLKAGETVCLLYRVCCTA